MSAIWLIFVALTLAVAGFDLATYRIPNWTWMALVALFAAVWVIHGTEGNWPYHIGAAAAFLVVGLVFFIAKQMGAGDAKFLAAVALFAGFSAIVELLLWIGIAAMVELIAIVVLRRVAPQFHSLFSAGKRPLARVLTKREAIPLGAGIALGAIVASHWFPASLWFV